MDNYFKQKNIKLGEKLQELVALLPPFCADYFLSIDTATSLLTRINYANDLRIFFYFLVNRIDFFKQRSALELVPEDLERLSSTHIELFIQYLGSYEYYGKRFTNGERGKSRKLSAVKNLYKFLFDKDLISFNVTEKVRSPKLHDKEIVRLEVDEVVKLLNQAEYGDGLTRGQKRFHDKLHKRDVAILTLFLGTGIRISECVSLNIGDIDFGNNSFKITRKGGNEAVLYFSDEVASALKEYIVQRNELLRKDKDNAAAAAPNLAHSVSVTHTLSRAATANTKALFISLQKKRISIRAVQNLVKKYSQTAAPLKKISPHKLRSTFGTSLYRETNDIFIVADVLGHKDVNTTKKHYAAISDDLRRNAAGKVRLRDED